MAVLKACGVSGRDVSCHLSRLRAIRFIVSSGGGILRRASVISSAVGRSRGERLQQHCMTSHIPSDNSRASKFVDGLVGVIPSMILYITVAGRGNSWKGTWPVRTCQVLSGNS